MPAAGVVTMIGNQIQVMKENKMKEGYLKLLNGKEITLFYNHKNEDTLIKNLRNDIEAARIFYAETWCQRAEYLGERIIEINTNLVVGTHFELE